MLDVETLISNLVEAISQLELAEQVAALNSAKTALHQAGPFAHHPVDCVMWIPLDSVQANDYNPNKVAPPEMRLLEQSIRADGYTQPIVAHYEGEIHVVVDGFHRNRVGKECPEVRQSIHGYLPVVRIRASQEDRENRVASTIRHNRARGKHAVEAMTDIVGYLAKKGWDNDKIAKELGMDADEILRFKQVSGLAELFADKEFTQAWEPSK
jgi:ParB-like chromosome segregation protein Spo0J